MPAIMGVVDHVRIKLQVGQRHSTSDKLSKDNYFATYVLLIDNSFILQPILCITINTTLVANVDMCREEENLVFWFGAQIYFNT